MQTQQEAESDSAMIALLELELFVSINLERHAAKIVTSFFDFLTELIRSGHAAEVKALLKKMKAGLNYSFAATDRETGKKRHPLTE